MWDMCDNIFQGGGIKESEMYLKKTQNNNKVYDHDNEAKLYVVACTLNAQVKSSSYPHFLVCF